MALLFIIQPLISAMYGKNFKSNNFPDITTSVKLFVVQILASKHNFDFGSKSSFFFGFEI
jgi:hypothetical protein